MRGLSSSSENKVSQSFAEVGKGRSIPLVPVSDAWLEKDSYLN